MEGCRVDQAREYDELRKGSLAWFRARRFPGSRPEGPSPPPPAPAETAGGQASGQARGPSPRFPLRSQRPEPPRLDTVTLHLEVQGLVVHLEEPSRPALVPPRGMKGQADRLSLRLGGGAGGDLLQGGPTIPRMPSRRALAVPSHRAVGHSTLATRRPVSAFPLRHRTRGHSRKRAAHGYGHASFPPPPNFPR